MKVSLFFSLREIKRRPRGFIALTAVSAALLTTLIMLLMYMNASWRNDVIPKKPQNYNFSIYDLDPLIKIRIAGEPWVYYVDDYVKYNSDGEVIIDSFRVRVLWSENVRALAYAREVFDKYDLWTTKPYKAQFESFYKEKLSLIQKEYLGLPTDTLLKTGLTIEQEALDQAKTKLLLQRVANTSYNRSVINTYVIRPEFFVLISMFSCFLCGAMVILISERYRTRMAEFGSLRSVGLKKRQLWYICGIDNLASSLVSVPIGIGCAALVVKLYGLIFADVLADDSIYLKLEENLPIAGVLIVALTMTVASLAGCMLVCYLYRDRTVMQLLKREGSVRVSFVAKTSPKFERAHDFRIYPELAHKRTRFSFILSTAIIVIMIPFPFSYLGITATTMFGATANPVEGAYFLFQSGVMFITAMIVIYISARSSTELRHGELGILRSLGMNRRMIRGTTFPRAIKQILYTSLPAVLLYLKLNDTSAYARTSSANRNLDINFGELLPQIGLEMLGVIILITPPIMIGVIASLRRFNRRSITESIRENE